MKKKENEGTSLVNVILRDRKCLLDWSMLHETSCLSYGPAGPHMPYSIFLPSRGLKNALNVAFTN